MKKTSKRKPNINRLMMCKSETFVTGTRTTIIFKSGLVAIITPASDTKS